MESSEVELVLPPGGLTRRLSAKGNIFTANAAANKTVHSIESDIDKPGGIKLP
jgi:hypothetical protein